MVVSMKIENLNVKNDAVEFTNINLDFSKTGVYLISGENGVGKTTIIESIIFGKNKFSFSSREQEENARKKYKLITYMSQNNIETTENVKEFICKGNRKICVDDINEMLLKFNLDHIGLKDKINHLSGGERIKLSIISALLKNTPYIFLDEPTNNLDDDAVIIFNQVIKEIAEKKTIIIITHDSRINFEVCRRVDVNKNSIKQDVIDGTKDNLEKCPSIKFYLCQIVFNILKNKVNLAFFCILISVVLLLNYYTHNIFEEEYPEKLELDKNIVMTYKADCTYSDLNQSYAKAESLAVKKENYKTVIKYDDVKKIKKMSGVDKIFMTDYQYFSEINEACEKETLLSHNYAIAIPNKISSNGKEILSWLLSTLCILEDGQLPQDGQSEICISKDLLKRYYKYGETQLENPIGHKIEYQDKVYTIVGISYYDICIISYEKEINLGFYEYAPNTYNAYVQKNVAYKEKEDMGQGVYYSDSMFILVDNGYEKGILNNLLLQYPGENYLSNYCNCSELH